MDFTSIIDSLHAYTRTAEYNLASIFLGEAGKAVGAVLAIVCIVRYTWQGMKKTGRGAAATFKAGRSASRVTKRWLTPEPPPAPPAPIIGDLAASILCALRYGDTSIAEDGSPRSGDAHYLRVSIPNIAGVWVEICTRDLDTFADPLIFVKSERNQIDIANHVLEPHELEAIGATAALTFARLKAIRRAAKVVELTALILGAPPANECGCAGTTDASDKADQEASAPNHVGRPFTSATKLQNHVADAKIDPADAIPAYLSNRSRPLDGGIDRKVG